jgi:hypothetical protein
MSRCIDILFYLFVLASLSDLLILGKSNKDFKLINIQFIIGAIGDASVDVNDHLEKGKKLLATGQLADALSHFHSAIGMIKYV